MGGWMGGWLDGWMDGWVDGGRESEAHVLRKVNIFRKLHSLGNNQLNKGFF
jgi:hypothetical protein